MRFSQKHLVLIQILQHILNMPVAKNMLLTCPVTMKKIALWNYFSHNKLHMNNKLSTIRIKETYAELPATQNFTYVFYQKLFCF